MKVSIAMATYNGEKYIEEQIESLRTQTYPADEVVIVDDCSTDSTLNIIKNYINKHKLVHWTYLSHAENQGYIRTFREALALTSGDIIFLSDQDDVWMDNKIEIMTSLMTNNPHISVLGSAVIKKDANLQTFRMWRSPFKSNENRIQFRIRDSRLINYTLRNQLTFTMTPGCAISVTRPLLNTYLDLPNNIFPHDTGIKVIASLQSNLYYLNVPLIKWRRHNFASSIKFAEKTYEKRVSAVKLILAQLLDLQDLISNVPNVGMEARSEAYKTVRPIIKTFNRRVRFLCEKQWLDAICLLIDAIFYSFPPNQCNYYRIHSWILDMAICLPLLNRLLCLKRW